MRPTRRGFVAWPAYSPDRARLLAAVVARKSRRFMGEHPEMGETMWAGSGQDNRPKCETEAKRLTATRRLCGAARGRAPGSGRLLHVGTPALRSTKPPRCGQPMTILTICF